MRFSAAFSLGLAVAALGASQAHAAADAYAPGDGTPTSKTLQIPVTASIGSTCGTTTLPTTSVDVGELNNTLNTSVAVTIKCSGAFRMGVVSSNGGLKTATTVPSGYANLRDYNVSLHIVDDSLVGHDSSTCAASTLTTATPTCTNLIGPATSAAPGFRVATSSQNQSGSYLLISGAYSGTNTLVAGSGYTDTLTITLTAAP